MPTAESAYKPRSRKSPLMRWQRLTDSSAGPDGCWPWLGKTNAEGFAVFRVYTTPSHCLAHRFAFATFKGSVPADHFVKHIATCPLRTCVNPAHLFTMRSDKAGKHGQHLKGAAHPGAKLSASDILAITADKRRGVEVAAAYGISTASVSRIRRGLVWKSLPRRKGKRGGQGLVASPSPEAI